MALCDFCQEYENYEGLKFDRLIYLLENCHFMTHRLQERKGVLLTAKRQELVVKNPNVFHIEFHYYREGVEFTYLRKNENGNLILNLRGEEKIVQIRFNGEDWLILNEKADEYVYFHAGSDGAGIIWTKLGDIKDCWNEYNLVSTKTEKPLTIQDLIEAKIPFSYTF